MVREYVPAYLAELKDTKKVVTFQIVPENLEISASPRYTEPAPLGRPEPYRVWMYNEPLTIKFNLTFFTVEDVYKDVIQPVTQLLAWAYPDIITAEGFTMTTPPPILVLRIGSFFGRNVIIRDIKISPHPDSPWELDSKYLLWPNVVVVDLNLQVVSETASGEGTSTIELGGTLPLKSTIEGSITI